MSTATQTTDFALPAPTDTDFEQFPIGVFRFRLSEMERGIEGSPEYGNKERVKWIFVCRAIVSAQANPPSKDVPDPKEIEGWLGEDLWAFTSLSMGTKSTMRAYSQALLGREVDKDENVKRSDLIGKDLIGTVGRSETGRAKLTSVLPYVPAKAKVKAAALAAADEHPEPYDAGEPSEDDPFD